MGNSFFKFKKFIIHQEHAAMKVTTDACLFGAWASWKINELPSPPMRMLDIGTGTGLLSLMTLQQHGQLLIDAVEMDGATANEAEYNVMLSEAEHKIKVINSDILKFKITNPYDLIISNPPFYERELFSGNSLKDLAHHSTSLTLNQLFGAINTSLGMGGTFMLLLPYKRKSELSKLAEENGVSICEQCYVRETASHPFTRILAMGKKGINQEKLHESVIDIRIAPGMYSPEFTRLLQTFYLYL